MFFQRQINFSHWKKNIPCVNLRGKLNLYQTKENLAAKLYHRPQLFRFPSINIKRCPENRPRFLQFMETLESHEIYEIHFQAWKVMEN